MVFKKSFTLLVATGTTPFFVVVSIIFENHCREKLVNSGMSGHVLGMPTKRLAASVYFAWYYTRLYNSNTHGESKIVRVIESSSHRELLMRIY